jgi:hypothetical protein
MLPPALLPELYVTGSLSRYGHSALPHAEVRPHVEPRRRLRRLAEAARRSNRNITGPAGATPAPIDVAPA